MKGPPSEAQAEALRLLDKDIAYFLTFNGGTLAHMDWAKLITTRRVEYSGKEAGAPTRLSWARMTPALPSAEACGRVPATSLAHPGIKRLLENPDMTLRPRSEWGPSGLTAPCHHVAADSAAIVNGLANIGLMQYVPLASAARCEAGPLLSGWFGVGKGTYLPGGEGDPDQEILRFIMNFVPLNAVSSPIDGDVEQLPYMGQWSNLHLDAWEAFVWSSEDIACMFYVISIPPCWGPYMCFNHVLHQDVRLVPSARVLGMGWLSSVGIAQHLIRQLILAASQPGARLPPAAELRKDVAMPAAPDGSNCDFWSVYLDDFDCAELGGIEELAKREGEVSEWQQKVRQAYAYHGVPRGSDKSIVRAFTAERLGAHLDGRLGLITGTEKKLQAVLQDLVDKTTIQMLAGRSSTGCSSEGHAWDPLAGS